MAISLLPFFFSLLASAHGGDQPGPNGGKVEMPGAFHTEVVPAQDGFKVYLLDMNFENASVKDSSVSAQVEIGKKKMDLPCSQQKDHFFCKFEKSLNSGKLVLKATREKATGNEAIYQLPIANPK